MPHCTSTSDEDSSRSERATQVRLAAIERHLQHIEALLVGIIQFNSRLDQISATLELASRFLTPDQQPVTGGLPTESSPTETHSAGKIACFQIVVYLSRDGHGARLVPDLVWTDIWSVRLFVTGLLRNMARSGLPSLGCRSWSQVWTPDETGELVDTAFLDPETGAIAWQSDLFDESDGRERS